MSATNGITIGVHAEEATAFFGEGAVVSSIVTDKGVETTAAVSWGNLFNFDTLLSVSDAANACAGAGKELKSADCLKSLIGVGSNFDPTGNNKLK